MHLLYVYQRPFQWMKVCLIEMGPWRGDFIFDPYLSITWENHDSNDKKWFGKQSTNLGTL